MKGLAASIILIAISMVSCRSHTSIEGFDDKAWREDNNGCMNTRPALLKKLLEKKDALKQLDDNTISKILGAPERNRQFPKGKKNYIYFIYPGKQCSGDTTGKEGKKLVVEFDPIGGVSMVRESFLDF